MDTSLVIAAEGNRFYLPIAGISIVRMRQQSGWTSARQEVGLCEIDDFGSPPAQHGFHHVEAEAERLFGRDRRRHRELLAIDDHV